MRGLGDLQHESIFRPRQAPGALRFSPPIIMMTAHHEQFGGPEVRSARKKMG